MREYVRVKRKSDKERLQIERVLGRHSKGLEGPSLLITVDVFGNVFSGVLAFLNVLDVLTKMDLPIKGEIIGLAGNIGLSKDLRLDMDQNWQGLPGPSFILRDHQGYNDDFKLLALIDEINKTQPDRTTDVFHLDLKTCPTVGRPYVSTCADLSCVRFAKRFPLCIVKGLESYVNDCSGFCLRENGFSSCTLKVGQENLFSPAKTQEAAIWLALVNSGCLKEEEVPSLSLYHKILKGFGENHETPSYEVIYRYAIQEDEFFRMIPGFTNFQRITKGEILATSDGGSIISQWDGRIFMPLYHIQSRDGFFILREED